MISLASQFKLETGALQVEGFPSTVELSKKLETGM
jgi:hypothetical protein